MMQTATLPTSNIFLPQQVAPVTALQAEAGRLLTLSDPEVVQVVLATFRCKIAAPEPHCT